MSQANEVYFVDVPYLKKFYSGYLDQNIDDDSLNSFILMAQDVRIQSTLGYDLYNKYINDINDIATGGPGPTGQYKYLLDNYIQRSCAIWAIYEAMPSLTFKMTNKSLSQKSSEYGQPSSQKDIEYIRTQLVNNAQFYDARIREYILNYPGNFPEYYTVSGVARIPAKNQPYDAGLYLPDYIPYYPNQNGWQQDDRCCTGRGTFLNW